MDVQAVGFPEIKTIKGLDLKIQKRIDNVKDTSNEMVQEKGKETEFNM